MKIRNLDTFYWIASLGSFRAASARLNLTQPAISARIQVLEQDLGASVFVREVRNAELTSAGRKLYPYAKRFMQLDQDILSAFSDSAKIEQTVRLGSSETVVSTWLPDFLGHLRGTEKQLSFDLSVDATGNLRNALVAREIDLAFLMGPISEVSITNLEICSYDMIFAASRELAAQKSQWSLADIAQKSVLTFSNNTKPNRQIRELLNRAASAPVNMTTSTSLGALIRLAINGFGICAMPKAVISSELEAGLLMELSTDVTLPSIAFTASFVTEDAASSLMEKIACDAVTFLRAQDIKNIYLN